MTSASRTVFITGGAQRVGRALALNLAQHGWDIAIHYNGSEEADASTIAECMHFGIKAVAVQADFTTDFDASRLLAEACAAIGPLHCLINSAAIIEKDTLQTFSHDAFHRHQQINAYAPLKLIQAFASHIRETKNSNACIINLADGLYGWSLSPKFLSYGMSKYGVLALTECLAAELAPAIRINSIGVGLTLPNVHDGREMFDRVAQRSPLQYPSSPDEICRTVDYLLDAPSVTGQHILLSGGIHLPGAAGGV